MRFATVGFVVLSSLTLASASFAQEPSPPMPPAPPVPPAPPMAPQPPAPDAPPMVPPHHHDGRPNMGGGPFVHPHVSVTVESTNPEKNVVIERRIKTDEMYGRMLFLVPEHSEVQSWEQVCVAPCKVELDRTSTYRVGRENSVTQSGQFTLPPSTDQVKLDVQPGNFWWHAVGTRLIGAGTVAAIVGGALISTASTWDAHSDEKHVRAAGIITGSIGLVLLAAGIPIAILSQTHVTANEKKVASTPPPPKLTINGLVF